MRGGERRAWSTGAALLLAVWVGAPVEAQGPDAPGDEAFESPSARPVDYALRWLRGERDRLADDLERFHARLVARATSEAPELLPRLAKDPPRRLLRGYARLPEILPDDPLEAIELRETTYSVEFSSRAYSLAFRDAAVLAERAEGDPGLALEWAVGEYERVQARLRNLDDNLAYQEFWQREVASKRAFFDANNEVLWRVRELAELRRTGADEKRRAALEREVREEVAPFHPTAGLAITTDEAGVRVLPVRVLTDVEDEAFLAVFEEAVRAAWTEAEACDEVGLRVVLELERVAPAELYPEGAPEPGATLDLEDHLARFERSGDAPLVLTTGAESTHAILGRYVQIGVRDVKPRVLAHEFGHLLGFSDAYLRGYEGDPEGRWGVRVIEVTGLLDDLMGSPARGRTSRAMIEELARAYGHGG